MLSGNSDPPLQIGDWVLDPSIDTITRGQEIQKLEPRTTRLLLLLAEAPGTVVSVDRILTEVWSGVIVGPASAYQAVSRLRRLLGDTDPEPTFIATVPRRGYRLVAPVRRLEPEAREPAADDARHPQPPEDSRPAPDDTPSVSLDNSPATRHEPRSQVPDGPHTTDTAGAPARMPAGSWLDRLGGPRARLAWMAVLATLVSGAAALVWIGLRPRPAPAPEPASVVVLPFIDMTAEKKDQAFCDGLTEELSNWLAQIPNLRVVARTSAFAYLGRAVDVRTIGKELGTSHVLEGSVRRSGRDLRVTAQLVETRDGYHVWSASFDRAVDDVVKVQEEIARSVADNLEIRLTAQTTARFAARSGASPRAYQLYMLAGEYRHALTRESNNRAIEQYEQALALDDRFALAYAGLASAYVNQSYLNGLSIGDVARKVEPLLAQGLKLNPNLPELYTARGALRTDQGRSEEALADLRHATDLNPNNSQALAEIGYLLLTNGRPREALDSYSLAARLDPLDFNLHTRRCVALTDMARFDEAEAACAHARALAPSGSWAYVATSWLDWARGRIPDALRWNAFALKASPDEFDLYDDRANLFLTLNMPAEARAILEHARLAIGNDERIGLLRAAVSFYEGGATALRSQLAAGHFDSSSSPTMLLRAARLELLAEDGAAARRLLEKALASAGGAAGNLDRPWYIRQGESGELTAALIELATAERGAATARLTALLSRLQDMQQAGGERYGLYTLRAQALALQGDSEGAMAALDHAADLGWRATAEATRDPALASLRSNPDFRSLVERIESDAAQVRPQVAGRTMQ